MIYGARAALHVYTTGQSHVVYRSPPLHRWSETRRCVMPAPHSPPRTAHAKPEMRLRAAAVLDDPHVVNGLGIVQHFRAP
ncbi:hypothetical protein GN244_ATG04529 [Phytophthora infestans]|nr:hypothetical protein GN244_ATG04529 [Phytophthora infestans]